MGGIKEYNRDVWEKFGDKVGWCKGGEWLLYSELIFDDKYYVGYLLCWVLGVWGIFFIGWVYWLYFFGCWVILFVDCNIYYIWC